MAYKAVNFKEKPSQFEDLWSPKVIAELNDYQLKQVKVKDDFVRHDNEDTTEVFIWEGELKIELRDGEVDVSRGEMFVVPKWTDHKPRADGECHVLIV